MRELPPDVRCQVGFRGSLTTHHSAEGGAGLIGAKEGEEAQVGKLLEKGDLRMKQIWKRCESLRSGGEVTWREVGWSLQGWWEAKWAGFIF